MFNWNKKEAPVLGLLGSGGGLRHLNSGSAAADPGPPIGDHFYQNRHNRSSASVDHPNFETGLSIGEIIPHEAIYNIPGAYQWTCPAGVTAVSVVCVGGGGGGTGYGAGGGGGGLAYRNNITVTPGTSYSVEVGYGGWPGNTSKNGEEGGGSRFDVGSIVTKAWGGNGAPSNAGYGGGSGGSGGSFNSNFADGGGSGGSGGSYGARGSGWNSGGGGGAGGYSGAGGNGGYSNSSNAGSGGNGTGGGGGGGAGGVDLSASGYGFGGEGGGVGIFGQGSNGSGGSNTNSVSTADPKPGIGGDGGSGGTDGGDKFAWDVPGTYGGGGAGGYMPGGPGAVRIVYHISGRTPSFPSTNVSKYSTTDNPYLWWIFTEGATTPKWYHSGAADKTLAWGAYDGTQTVGVGKYDSLTIYDGLLGKRRDPNQHQFASYTARYAHGSAYKPGTGFMDLVSWDGNGASSRTISHSLGSSPGFIRVYADSDANKSTCYHNDGTTVRQMNWSTTFDVDTYGKVSSASSSDFTLTNGTIDIRNVNKSSVRYTAAVFASNDTVKCGSWTGTGGNNNINLGFTNGAQQIWIYDTNDKNWYFLSVYLQTSYGQSTLGKSGTNEKYGRFNSSTLTADNIMNPYSGGFQLIHGTLFNTSGVTYLYVAFTA